MNSDSSTKPSADDIRWRRIVILLKRRWWLLVLLAIVGFAGTAAWQLSRPEMYQAVSRMWVGGKLQLPAGATYAEEWQYFFGTQMELMKSPHVRRRAYYRVQALNQSTNTEPLEINVSQPRKSATFVLSAEGEDPEYLEAYLNAVMDEYLAYRREVRAENALDTVASLTDQVYDQERKLQAAQEALVAFQKEYNAVSLQEEGVSSAAYLAKLNTQLSDLRLEHGLLEHSNPNDLLGVSPRLVGATIDRHSARELNLTGGVLPPEYLTAKQALEMLKIERADLAENLREEHPKLIKLDEKIARAEQLIEVFQQQTTEQLQDTREALERKMETMEGLITRWEDRVVELNRRYGEYERLKMNVVRMQSLYDPLLALVQNVDLNQNIDQELVNVLDRASAIPAGGRWYVMAGAAAFALFAFGVFTVLVQERMDGRVLDAGDVRAVHPGLPLATIPKVRFARHREGGAPTAAGKDQLILSESFRVLRGAIQNHFHGMPVPRLLLVSSPHAGEGKTTVSLQLARTLAFAGRSVLLIDADLRRKELTAVHQCADMPGLVELLAGKSTVSEVVRELDSPNLGFLPAGHNVSSDDVLDSPQAGRLLRSAGESFDFVIVDSPPLLVSADASSIAPHCDGVLLVAAERVSRLPGIRAAQELLDQREAKLVGIVLNQSRTGGRAYQSYSHRSAGRSKAA